MAASLRVEAMVGQAPLVESSIPLTLSQLAHHGMGSARPARPEEFPSGEGYGILGVPCGDPRGRSQPVEGGVGP